MDSRHSHAVNRLLRKAGWRAGRRVDLTDWDRWEGTPFPAAREVLAEFGGLVIGEGGPGVDFAATVVDLRPVKPVRPEFAGYEDIERALGLDQSLYLLGTADNENVELLIDESGRVYGLMDDVLFLAPTFSDALEVLLLGKRWTGR